MNRSGNAALIGSLVCFVAYFSNVLMGASGTAVLMGGVPEMVALRPASFLFVVGVPGREPHERPDKT